MGCSPYWQQVNEVSSALRTLSRFGLGESDAFRQLNALRGKLLTTTAIKFPRTITQLTRLFGLSPHELALFHDAEAGFMVEARTGPGAPPFYHRVDPMIAVDILHGRRLHEYAEFYARPAENVDN